MFAETTLMTEPGLFKKRFLTIQIDETSFTIVSQKETQLIRWSDVSEFAFSSVAQYFNGQACGTTHVLEISAGHDEYRFVFIEDTVKVKSNRVLGIPLPFDVPGNSIRVNADTDPVLATLRDTLQHYVVQVMIENFNSGRSVNWVPDVALTQQAIVFQNAIANFDQITKYRVNNGELKIDTNSKTLSSLKIPFGAMNFLPGFQLFEEILTSRGMIKQKLAQAV